MAYSIARLTLYALLTAVESDLRDAIIANLSPKREVSEILPVKIYERARDRMERDRGFDPDLETKVLEYLDFSESIEVLQSHKSDLDGTLQKAIRSIIQTSSEIALIRNRVMHSRPLEFDDFAKGSEFCKQLLSFPTYPIS